MLMKRLSAHSDAISDFKLDSQLDSQLDSEKASKLDHNQATSIIGVGTAQFGLNYGISNTLGQVAQLEVDKIVDYLIGQGITCFDTAPIYGDSELALGNAFNRLRDEKPYLTDQLDKLSLCTKILKISNDKIEQSDLKAVENGFMHSLMRLNVESVDVLMVHQAEDLYKPQADKLWALLESFIDQGYVNKVGVSLYQPRQARELSSRYPIHVFQFPVNVFDRRFIDTGVVQELHEKGASIHARSLLLQGLLLMPKHELPHFMHSYQPLFEWWWSLIKQNKVEAIEAAITFVKSLMNIGIDQVIIGAASQSQWAQIMSIIEKEQHDICFDISQYLQQRIDEDLINPSRWAR